MSSTRDDPAKQYHVDTRTDIIAILGILCAEQIPLTLFYDGTQSVTVTLLAIQGEQNQLVLDVAPLNPAQQQALAHADSVDVHAQQEQVKIRFQLYAIQPIQEQGRAALCAALPAALLGEERRENYRAKTEREAAASLLIPISGLPELYPAHVADISSGGCAFEIAGNKLSLDPGTVLNACQLVLPNGHSARIAIEIRHSADIRNQSGAVTRRFGCRFVNLDTEASIMVRSYMHQIDSQQLRGPTNILS